MTRIHNVATGAKTARGEYSSYLGKKHVGGRLADAKFYLGYDENEATIMDPGNWTMPRDPSMVVGS